MNTIKMRLFILFTILILFYVFPSSGTEITAEPHGVVPVDTGNTITLSISLSDAANGVSGYQIEYSSSNTSVISLMNCSFPDWVKLSQVNSSSQSEGFVKGVDLEQKVEAGNTPVPLFSLHIVGNSPGSTTLILTPKKIEDDFGGRYSIAPLSIQISVRQNEPVSIQTTSISSQYSGSSGGSSSGGYSSVGVPSGIHTIQVTPTIPVTDNPQPIQQSSPASTETLQDTIPVTTVTTTIATPPVTHVPLFWPLYIFGFTISAFLSLFLRKNI